jgi:4-amino-4-deoxy-L-arabinose transferase-like glycosyltransferase
MSEQYIKIKNLMGNISTGQTLLLLLCLGFFIRLYVVMNAVTLSVDSTLDLKLAKAFSEWNFYGGLDMNRPPLHPILVSLTYPIFQDYEFAARIISLIFGTLVIPVSFYLGRFIYNERAGLVTAFFTTVHPYMVRYSGDTLREGLYYFLVSG